MRGQEQSYEVRRVLKAFVDAQWLAEFDARLEAYRGEAVARGSEADDDEGGEA